MQQPQAGAAPGAPPASPFAFGTPSAPAAPAGGQPGMLANLLDPNNPGGKNGLLARMRAMMAGSAPAGGGGPMSLAPPDVNNVDPQMPDPGAGAVSPTAISGMW